MKIFPALIAVLLWCVPALSQTNDEDNKNITLQELKREFRFAKGNSANPVLVQEESIYTYRCNEYRTAATFAEFYNDMETIDDVKIVVNGSKKHGVYPKYDFYESDGIFYSDARVCHFSLPLIRKDALSSVSIEKTILDPKYFTSVHFLEAYPVQSQEVIIRIPSWMKVELRPYNFERYHIQQRVTQEGDETVYRFTGKDLPALRREPSAPGFTYFSPHILVMAKFAETSNGKLTFFNTLQDQYNWYRQLVVQAKDNSPSVKERALDITRHATTDEQKVKLLYQWVQDNIRYIAFEDGLAGFRPAKASDVLNKKYGDCKGMANLLVEMLQSLGLDARHCWIGTRHLAYDYTTPSLAVDNHMIAVWMNQGEKVYLDATEKYIGYGEFAERIQGRQTLIEDGGKFILDRVPAKDAEQNTSFEKRLLTIDGNNLRGQVVQSWKGENKVMLLTGINSLRTEKRDVALSRYLSEGKSNFEIQNLQLDNIDDYNKDVKLEYQLLWKNALATFGAESYLELDNRRNFESFKIDSSKRKLPYWFDFKNHIVLETELQLPAGIKPGPLPEALLVKRPAYQFSGSYRVTGSTLTYRCEIRFQQTALETSQFSQWNSDIDQLKNFYNQQIVLTTTK